MAFHPTSTLLAQKALLIQQVGNSDIPTGFKERVAHIEFDTLTTNTRMMPAQHNEMASLKSDQASHI